MVANENLATNNIVGTPGGNIDLKANGGSGNPFIIGSTGNTNGVNGTITALGAASTPITGSVAVYITNMAGGIQLADPTSITAAGSGSNAAGAIILNAESDTLEVTTAGTLSADGSGDNLAGQIQLIANTVTFDDSATLSASQTDAAGGSLHGVAIAAETVNFSDGLTINANGSGYGTGSGAFASLLAEGATTITETGDYTSLFIGIANGGGSGGITYSGSELNINVSAVSTSDNVDYGGILVSADPITFSGGPVTLASNMSGYHTVEVLDTGAGGITFSNSGEVTLDASGPDSGTGVLGAVYVSTDLTSGTISVPSASNFNLYANGVGYGNTGTVSLSANNLSLGTSTLMSATADADPAGGGNGGQISIDTYGTFTVGSGGGQAYLSAQAVATGDNGGTIIVDNPSTLTVDGGSLLVTSVDAPGGTIELLNFGTLTVTGTLAADGVNYMDYTPIGTVLLSQLSTSTSTMTLDDATISASSDPTYAGDAGNITITNYGPISMDGTTVQAFGQGDDDGNGGNINVTAAQITLTGTVTANADLSGAGSGGNINLSITGDTAMDASNATIEAQGGDSGTGGTVYIDNVSYFDVDSDVDDDADDDATDVDTDVFDGIIGLNDPNCQRDSLGSSTWPFYYQNCVNLRPSSPSDADGWASSIIASNLSGAIGANTGINKIKLWVFNNIDDINSYFKIPDTTDQPYAKGLGDTRNPPNPSSNINSAVVENSPFVTDGVLTEFNVKEVAIHEMGHALDHLIGQTNQSASSDYNNYVQNDFLLLDYVGGVVSPSTIRPACAASGDGGPAPFANVSTVCSGGTQIAYTMMMNSAILRTLSHNPGVFHQKIPPGLDVLAWDELYAQALSVDAYLLLNSISSSNYLYAKTTDWVLTSGYFSCTLQWADAVRAGSVNTGSYTPSGSPTENYSSTSCSASLPGGYTAITN